MKLNWKIEKDGQFIDYIAYGNGWIFKIFEFNNGYLLRKKNLEFTQNIGHFSTIEKAKTVAELVDGG